MDLKTQMTAQDFIDQVGGFSDRDIWAINKIHGSSVKTPTEWHDELKTGFDVKMTRAELLKVCGAKKEEKEVKTEEK